MIESRIIGKPTFTETGSECLTLADVKAHVYIDSGNTDFDARLTALITEVRQWIEEITATSLIVKTVEVILTHNWKQEVKESQLKEHIKTQG